MVIAIGCDHAGWELKEFLKEYLVSIDYKIEDYGTNSNESVDYPDYGIQVAEAVSCGKFERAILICGTGVGMSIVANKFPGVRAAFCHDIYTARASREHNNSNILILGGRTTSNELGKEIVNVWISTPFSEEERHRRRIEKIKSLEKKLYKSCTEEA